MFNDHRLDQVWRFEPRAAPSQLDANSNFYLGWGAQRKTTQMQGLVLVVAD
jgi:hypothetical protein